MTILYPCFCPFLVNPILPFFPKSLGLVNNRGQPPHPAEVVHNHYTVPIMHIHVCTILFCTLIAISHLQAQELFGKSHDQVRNGLNYVQR